jgi:hypothetical protein
MFFMSTQKLRTIKGLGWLTKKANTTDRDAVLKLMIELRQRYCAIWMESVWLIADASESKTKFIISDHPITIYNKRLSYNSPSCKNFSDPDIRYNGSHTIFPLSRDKILILTNLSWLRNPYGNPIEYRPNPVFNRNAMMNFLDIQTLRKLSEQEVREINFVIKKRAHRYIGAAEEDWLYPEKYLNKPMWSSFGDKYLFMPDPRSATFGGETIIGWKNGTSTISDEYGQKPWESKYRKNSIETDTEFRTFHHFQGDFARMYGPYRRGRCFEMGTLSAEKDNDKFHSYHLEL